MDHLPYPENPAHQPIRVPNFVAVGVVACATDRPVDRWRKSARPLRAHNLLEQTTTLQKWLYFGLISRCTGEDVDVEAFNSRGTLVSQAILEASFCAIDIDDELQDVELGLRAFSQELLGLLELSQIDEDLFHDADSIILSIRVLADYLRRAYRNHTNDSEDLLLRHHDEYNNRFAPAGLQCAILRKRMSWHWGWCASVVSEILQSYTASTAYYLSAIPCPRVVAGNPDHRNCTDEKCNLNYDERNYQQAHTSQCQGDEHGHCQMIDAPVEDIANILQAGGIPLVKLTSRGLVAKRVEYGLPYVAATHVWAGGLGNPKGNIMWLCQLQELSRLTALSQKAIRRFQDDPLPETWLPTICETIINPFRWLPKSSPTWYWIDTLTIPRVDEETAFPHYIETVLEKRVLAIDRMTQTYAAADSAVVLDPELRRLNLRWYQRPTDPDDCEVDRILLQIFSSILISSWMTRCWTYQEGAVAKELLVKLSHDDLFPMRLARSDVVARNLRRLKDSRFSDIHDMLDETSAWFSRLPATQEGDANVGRKEIDKDDPEVFTRIWNDLAARSTTRTIDRLSILSLLVDLRPSEVRQEHPRARLKAIFKAQEKLPLALLFQPPLTGEEEHETIREFEKEEAAEVSRGKSLRPYEEDDSYPLPTSLRSKRLPGQLGWMERGESQDEYIYFDTELLKAGIRQPALFKLPPSAIGSATQHKLLDTSQPCSFDIDFSLASQSKQQQARALPALFLLTSSKAEAGDAFRLSDSTFPGVLLEELGPSRISAEAGAPQNTLQFRYICHVTCSSFNALDEDWLIRSGCPINIGRVPFVDDFKYRIDCKFSNVTAPSSHRIRGFVPEWITAFYILTTIMPVLVFYYIVCFGLCCIAGFAHAPGSFPRNWLAMIGFLFVFRWLFFSFNNTRDYRLAAIQINFKEWVNGIGGTDGTPIIDSQRAHTGFNVNMNLRDTLALTLLCSIFIIAGAAKYSDEGYRWMIAVGGSGLGELLMRWGLELCLPTSRFWGALPAGGRPEHPGARNEYLSPSRLTRWLKLLLGDSENY